MIKFSASASVFTEEIKGKDIFDLLSGSDQEVVSRLVGLIEDELGELPLQELHCGLLTFLSFFLSLSKQKRKGKHKKMKSFIISLKNLFRLMIVVLLIVNISLIVFYTIKSRQKRDVNKDIVSIQQRTESSFF